MCNSRSSKDGKSVDRTEAVTGERGAKVSLKWCAGAGMWQF